MVCLADVYWDLITVSLESVGSSSSIAPGIGAESPMFDSRQRNKLSFFPQRRIQRPTQPPTKCVPKAVLSKVNWTGSEANHLQTCSVEFINSSSYTSTPTYVFTVLCSTKHKNTFSFFNPSMSASVHRTFLNAM
jgi:hypothetical protein